MTVNFVKTLTKDIQEISSNVEHLMVQGRDLSSLPTLPLYLTLKKLPVDKTALFLDKCSKSQRQHFLDIDMWEKDELDFEDFSYWIRVYNRCQNDDVKKEFVLSPAFGLYLKSRFNLMSLDGEHPIYPDHDNFFITDDNMILVEYDKDFDLILELKALLGRLYDGSGVGQAWAILFKIIGDSFTVLREEEYLRKKERLRDIGMVDYYDALPFLDVFFDENAIHHFIDNKKEITGKIDQAAKKESPHPQTLVSWQQCSEKILEEFSHMKEKRKDFLIFDFTRQVNAVLALGNVMKRGSIAVGRVGNTIKNYISLGLWYTKKRSEKKENLFVKFSFSDFYKIGRSLVVGGEKLLIKALRDTPFVKNNTFLGDRISRHLMESFDDYLKNNLQREEDILVMYQTWMNQNQTIFDIIPYVEKFHRTFEQIVKKQQIQDDFYINYKVEEMDFEALLVSNFVNFSLGHKTRGTRRKLAVSMDEFKIFYNFFFNENGELKSKDNLQKKVGEFASFYGLDRIFMFMEYFTAVLNAQLAGYRPSELKKEEFRYIGGPVIFDDRTKNFLAHFKSGI